jgi:hypothetical protein
MERHVQTADRAPSRYLWSAKRQHRRVSLDVPLIVKRDGTFTAARSIDLSEGGLGAKVRGSCAEGQIVELQFALDSGATPMHLRAICRYSSDARHGFQFLNINAKQRETIAELVKANQKKTVPESAGQVSQPYKFGGKHAAGCICPNCGGSGGVHSSNCMCEACGGFGGDHNSDCRCASCRNSPLHHAEDCRCSKCGVIG